MLVDIIEDESSRLIVTHHVKDRYSRLEIIIIIKIKHGLLDVLVFHDIPSLSTSNLIDHNLG